MNHIECCLQEKEISCTRNRVKVILGKAEFLAANTENEYPLACPRGPHETRAGEADTAKPCLVKKSRLEGFCFCLFQLSSVQSLGRV